MYSLMLSLILACGPKKTPEPPVAAAPAPAPAPEPEAAPEPEPEVVEPPPAVSNADFNVTISYADGTSKSGHIKRVERSSDWYGDEGWTDAAKDLNVSAEGTDAYETLTWDQIDAVSIKPGAIPADVSCVYDSNFTPWMYDCTLKTTGSLTSKDGRQWTVDNRHKWRFTFDDDSEVEFWLKKHPAREQDAEVVSLDKGNPENYDLYTSLQQRLRKELKTTLVVKVDIQ